MNLFAIEIDKLKPWEHILKYSLTYLNMRKIGEDKLEKIKNDHNM